MIAPSDDRAPTESLLDDLTRVTSPQPAGEGRFTLEVAAGWQQGRGAFGGLALGALARAVSACEPDPSRVLRSLTGELTGPVLVGPATIDVRALRIGSGVSTWHAALAQDGQVLATATAVMGRARPGQRAWSPPAPEGVRRPFESVEVAPVGPPFAPDFARFLEFRPVSGLPFSGQQGEPESAGWVRPRRAAPELSSAEVVALADAWWPAALAQETAPRPIGTVAFTLQHFPPASPLRADRPLFHRARAVAAQDGFVVELRELWTEQGALVAMNQQTIVWIR